MSFAMRSLLAVLLLGFGLTGSAWAENEGQEDLDQATQAKVSAKTLSDLGDVVRLAESALQKGLDKENQQFAKQLLASTLLQRGQIRARLTLGSLREGTWEEHRRIALQDLERAVNADPDLAEAYLRIAQLNLLPQGDAKRSQQAIDAAIEHSKDQPMVHLQALVLRAGMQKDASKKRADLDEAVRTAPAESSARRERGLLLAQAGEYEAALADFSAALETDPGNPIVLEAKVTVLARLKKNDEVQATVAEWRKRQPKSVLPLISLARFQSAKEDHQAAIKTLEEALALDADNPAVLLTRASVYHEMKEKAKAMADVEKVLRLYPDLEMARRLKVILLADQGNLKKAITEMESILKQEPDDAENRLELAMLFSNNEQHDKAIEIYSSILKAEPESFAALRGRGDSYLGVGKHAEAIADYEKAFKLRAHDSGLLNNFAWVLATSPVDDLRHGKRAIGMAEEAAKLTDYKAAHILSTLAAAYAESGDFDKAIEWSQKSLAAAKEELKEPLSKELESYKAKKPFRELKTGKEERQADKETRREGE